MMGNLNEISPDDSMLPCEISSLPNEVSPDDDTLPYEISILLYEISSVYGILPCEISTLPYEISTDDGTLPLKSHHYPMKSDQMMELMIKNPSLSSGIVRNRGARPLGSLMSDP